MPNGDHTIRSDWSLCCEAAQVTDGRLSLVHLFDAVVTNRFPAVVSSIALVAHCVGTSSERLALRIRRPDDAEGLLDFEEMAIDLYRPCVVARCTGWTVYQEGAHLFELLIGERVLATFTISVALNPASPTVSLVH